MRAPLSQQAQQAVRQYIIDNRLGPGDPLPSEGELSTLLDMGKTSVREGVRGLQSLGVVEVRHGRGLFVSEFSFAPILDQLPYRLMIDDVPLRDVLQVRRALEEGLIVQAGAQLSDDLDALDALDALVERMRTESVDDVVPAEIDNAFHQGLFRGLGNPLVLQMIGIFWTIFDRAAVGTPDLSVHHTADDHAAIVDAIRGGDPDAMRAAVAHHFADIERNVGSLSAHPHAPANAGN